MSPVAQREAPEIEKSVTSDPLPPEMGSDGYPTREWRMPDGSVKVFSLKPYDDRPLYWNPYGFGQQMWWRSQVKNRLGFHPVIQRETWWDGKFSPRNEWEEHMTREWLNALEGGNADAWKGVTHPDGPGHYWRCGTCSIITGNWRVFVAHQKKLSHTGIASE
jgi:hypothetical protein